MPTSPTEWEVPRDGSSTSHTWLFHGSDFEALDQARPLLDKFQRTRELQQWRAAAAQFCGEGVAEARLAPSHVIVVGEGAEQIVGFARRDPHGARDAPSASRGGSGQRVGEPEVTEVGHVVGVGGRRARRAV